MSGELGSTLISVFAITGLFGWIGFNQPSWSRTYTTAFRYNAALVAHVLLYVGTLLVCFLVLGKVFERQGDVGMDLALVLPFLAIACVRATRVSRWIRNALHRAAGMPTTAVHLAERLTIAQLTPNEAIESESRAILANRGIDASCDWLPSAHTVYEKLANATALFLQLRDWLKDREFAGFVGEAAHEFDHLRQEFDRVSFRFARAIASIERIGRIRYVCSSAKAGPPVSSEADEDFRKLVKDIVADVGEDVNAFYQRACLLLARGILTTQLTESGRDRALSRIGIRESYSEAKLAISALLRAGVLLYVGIWLFFIVLPTEISSLNLPLPMKHRVTIITIIVLGALTVAIVPKLYWGFANAGLHDKTPMGFLIGAGFAAVLFAVAVNLGAGALIYGGLEGALRRLREGLPYFPSAFMTAATVGWLVQDHRWLAIATPRLKRMLDAVTLGGVWVAATLIAQWIKYAMGYTGSGERIIGEAVGAFIFGGVIGYFVPGLVRIGLDERPHIRVRNPVVALAPVAARATAT